MPRQPADAGEPGPSEPWLAVSPPLGDAALNALFAASWPAHEPTAFGPRHARSLLWTAAFRAPEPDGPAYDGPVCDGRGYDDRAYDDRPAESDGPTGPGDLPYEAGRTGPDPDPALAHRRARELVGYVNVVGDGGVHAFLLDTTVHPSVRRQGLGVRLVRRAADEARRAGAHWLHVDYEPHLTGFYARCGFAPTAAGLRRLV